MKFIFLYIFFCSIKQFLSSPITTADVKAHNDLVKTLDPFLKSAPKTDNINTMNSKIGKEGEEKSVTAAKSIEIRKHTTDEYKNSNVERNEISLGSTTNAQFKSGPGKLSTNEKPTENQHNHDFGRHEQAAVFSNTPLSKGTFTTKNNEINLEEKRLFRNIINEKTLKEKRVKDNINEILNKINEVVSLKNDAFRQSLNKMDLQTSKEIKSTFTTLSTTITNDNKNSTISNNSGNNLLENHQASEKLDMKQPNAVNLKDKRNIVEDAANVFKSSNVKLNDSEQNSHTEQKTSNLIEEIPRKYQENPKQLTTNVGIISEKRTSTMKSEKSITEKRMENLGNSDVKTSSMALGTNNKQQDNSTDKETKKSSEKVKSLESDHVTAEKKLLNYSTSTIKRNGSDAKLVEADNKQPEKKISNAFTTIKNKVITTAKENPTKFIIKTALL